MAALCGIASLLAGCEPEVSARCKEHQSLAQKEILSMNSLLNQLSANPLLAVDSSNVEKVNYFNSHTSSLLNDMKSVCGERQDMAWTEANMPLLVEAQASLKRFNETKEVILRSAERSNSN